MKGMLALKPFAAAAKSPALQQAAARCCGGWEIGF
jgi:hypothetical protein